MAKEIKVEKSHDVDLYDSVNKRGCVTEKAVDITEDCPGALGTSKVLLLYTRSGNDRIVQIRHCGCKGNFLLEELTHEMTRTPQDESLGAWADVFGVSKPALRSLIETNARKED